MKKYFYGMLLIVAIFELFGAFETANNFNFNHSAAIAFPSLIIAVFSAWRLGAFK
jgi:hypothetical protein